MDGLVLRDFLLYTSLGLFVLYTLRINNMWGVSKGTKKAKLDVKESKDLHKKRLAWLKVLQWCEWVCVNVGSVPDENTINDTNYRISRLRLKIDVLERNIKAKELLGLLKGIQLVGIFCSILALLLTKNVMSLGGLLLYLAPSTFNVFADTKINDEDIELEKDFPDLFLLLHVRLLKGSKTRLSPTLDDYIKSLDAMYQGKSHIVIRNFVVDLRNNIEIYGDDSIAVYKLRDMYRSSMVVNFCNLATQSLKGVDNKDKLLAFKIELTQQKQEDMKLRAKKLVDKGRRSIIVIYIILGEFVVLSWLAKLGTMRM